MFRYLLSQPILVAILVLIAIGVLVVVGLAGYPTAITRLATPTPTITSTPTPSASTTLAPTGKATSTPTEAPTWTDTPPATAPPLTFTPTLTGRPRLTFTPTPTEPPPTHTAVPTEPPPSPSPPTSEITGRLAVPLFYGIEPKVYIVSTDGEQLGTLGAARQPDYRRDGTKLIVNGAWGDWMMLREEDASGGSPRQIGDPALIEHGHPAWSPDGTHIIYDDDIVDPKGPRIYIRDLNTNGPGTGPGTILNAGVGTGEILGRHPLWATEDRFIFQGCGTWQPGKEGACGIWAMQGNSGSPEQLTFNPRHVPTDVHGDVVVYVSDEAGDWNVYTLNIVDGRTEQITFDKALDGLPTISPDGRWIAFLSERGGELAMWYVSIGGGTPQKLFDINATWGSLRPDGWSEEKLSWGQID